MKKVFVLLVIILLFNTNVNITEAEESTLTTIDETISDYDVDYAPQFFNHKYMAHAGGGYEETIYNNTEEAIINSIKNGFKFIEVDMLLTSDNKLVCSHGWDKNTYKATGIDYKGVPTYDEFMSWKIQDKHSTIDASTIIDYMKEYPDLLVEIDLKKYGSGKTKRMINQLVKLADNDEEILDRNTGDSLVPKNHLVIVPDTSLYSHVMNDTNTTEGGYTGSKMYTEGLTQAKAIINNAFSGHVVTFRAYLCNAVSNGEASAGGWVDSTVDLMNEIMVYGSVVNGAAIYGLYNIGTEKSQLPLFALNPQSINTRYNYWLKDVVSASYFAGVFSLGLAYHYSASYSLAVRPAFSYPKSNPLVG